MSLRAFHIVFISLVLLLSVFFLMWGFKLSPEKGGIHAMIGWCGVIGLLVTPVYGVYFWKKAKNIVLT